MRYCTRYCMCILMGIVLLWICTNITQIYMFRVHASMYRVHKLLHLQSFFRNWVSIPCQIGKTYIYVPKIPKVRYTLALLRPVLGDTPYKCTHPDCLSTFSRSDELTRHRRKHTDVRPFACAECSLSYARADHLHVHLKNHLSKKSGI